MTDENEASRWIDEELRASVRELRMALLSRTADRVPAARDAWTEAAQMVVAIMQQHGIPFDEPQPEAADITPALVDRLLDEAELSPGPITPAVRAMLAILRRLHTSGGPAPQFDQWSARALALFDGRPSNPLGIDHSEPVTATTDGGEGGPPPPPPPPPPPDRPLPASRAATPPAQA